MFDEQPDEDVHGECAAEIHRLQAQIAALTAQLAQYQQAEPAAMPIYRVVALEPEITRVLAVEHVEATPKGLQIWVKLPASKPSAPAAMAAVLPEEMKEHPHIGDGYRNGWNDCCEEVRRLNAHCETVAERERDKQDAERYRWQPIETASDHDPDAEIVLCFEPHEQSGFIFPGVKTHEGKWINTIDLEEQEPTHWMPAPEYPIAAIQASQSEVK